MLCSHSRDLIEDYYFKPNQMGSLEAMTPGILDVRCGKKAGLGTKFTKIVQIS